MSILWWVPTVFDRSTTRSRSSFTSIVACAVADFAATLFGNGVFTWFSYIKPFMIHVSGFSESAMIAISDAGRAGMVIGNLLSGKNLRSLQSACALRPPPTAPLW